jgi:hypothetical protein
MTDLYIQDISNALTALGKCHQRLNERMTIGRLKRVMEREGFTFSASKIMLNYDEECTDMSIRLSSLSQEDGDGFFGFFLTNISFGDTTELSIRADQDGLYLCSMDHDDEFHVETFCSSETVYSLDDLVNLQDGVFSCGANVVAPGPKTSLILEEIRRRQGLHYEPRGKDPVTWMETHPDSKVVIL